MRLTSSSTFQKPGPVDDLRRLIEQRQLSTSLREQTIMKAFIVDRYKKKGALRFADMPEPALRDDDVLVMKRPRGYVGALSQAPAKRNVVAGDLIERDHEIIRGDIGGCHYRVVQCFQQSQALLFGTTGDERDLQDNQIIRVVEAKERGRVKILVPGQNVEDLKEVFRRDTQSAYEAILHRARHLAQTSFVILPFQYVDLGDWHVRSPSATCGRLV
jgi:hypothetical protein